MFRKKQKNNIFSVDLFSANGTDPHHRKGILFAASLILVPLFLLIAFHVLLKINFTLGSSLAYMAIAIMAGLAISQSKMQRALEEDANSLRLQEELYRLAMAHSSKHVMRLDIKNRTLWIEDDALYGVEAGMVLENIPESILKNGIIASKSKTDIKKLFDDILRGEKTGSCEAVIRNSAGDFCPYQINYTAIFDEEQKPVYAIITLEDIAAVTQKEMVYKRWRQTLETLPQSRYRLIEHNLSGNTVDNAEGGLFDGGYIKGIMNYDQRMASFVQERVFPKDAPLFEPLMKRETLLADYHEGKRWLEFEFRLYDNNHELRWVKLSMQMVEYPNSTAVKVYKMYEDIDARKKKELALAVNSQQDPLTKLLNRRAFEEAVAEILADSKGGRQHALLLLDIDHLKRFNDKLGHAAGDKALIMMANNLRIIFDKKDVIGRLGGDEFYVLMRDIPGDIKVADCARQVNEALQKAGDSKISISCSIGIALYPKDGGTLEELYKSADDALYRVKDKGRRNYSFFSFREGSTNQAAGTFPQDKADLPFDALFISEEDLRYRNLIKFGRIAVIEVDLPTHEFFYDKAIPSILGGNFDERPLWNILLEDEVAAPQAILDMQALIKKLTKEKNRDIAVMKVQLKNASGAKSDFHMKVVKVREDQDAASKMLITFTEAQEELM